LVKKGKKAGGPGKRNKRAFVRLWNGLGARFQNGRKLQGEQDVNGIVGVAVI